MFDRIIQFSLRYKLIIVCAYLLLFFYGYNKAAYLSVDVFPDLNKPTVSLIIETEGLAVEEIEKQILIPVENAVNGASGITRLTSSANVGYGIVKAEFNWDTDIFKARQIINERLSTLQQSLPDGTRIAMGPVSSIMGEVMIAGLFSSNNAFSSMQLRSIADNLIRKRLLGIPGVSNVSTIGGDIKQYQIMLDPIQMQLMNISLSDVIQSLQNSGLNSTAGFLQEAWTEKQIRILGRPETIADLKKIVLAKEIRKDAPGITLEQIADIREAPEINKRGDAGINANPGVLISIAKQPGIDTLSLTRQLETELSRIQKILPENVILTADIFKQSRFIQRAIDNITEALWSGSILIAVILFLFLVNFRSTAIILTVIPTSFIMTAIVFDVFGLNINTMTLGGLAMAIGSLVDDAIVDVTNIYKRLKENKHSQTPRPVWQVVFEASKEVRNSIIFSTVLVFLVFIPLFALSGIEGKIFTPLAIAFILSMTMSTVVALTLTPALSAYLLPSLKSLGRPHDAWIVRILKKAQDKGLRFCFYHTKGVLIALGIFFVLLVCAALEMGREFLPPFNEGSFNIAVASAPGTNLTESNRIGQLAEKALLSIPDIVSTGRKTGRADLDEHALGVHISEIEVELKPKTQKTKEELMSEIREKLNIPGIFVNIGQPISHRIDFIISGSQSQLAIKLFGSDTEALRKTAEQIEHILKEMPEITDITQDMQILIPEIHIQIDRDKAARHGVQTGTAVNSIETALAGRKIAQIQEDERSYDLVLMFKDALNITPDVLGQLPVETVKGYFVPLSTISEIYLTKSPSEIARENGSRRLVIQANIIGRDLVKTAQNIEKRIENEISFPENTFWKIDGQFESQQTAARHIFILALLSLTIMFGALYINFKSLNLALQLMITLPLSLMGAVIGLFLTSRVISIASIVGLIALVGIAIRNGILLMELYLHKEAEKRKRLTIKELINTTKERLEPVMMTTLTSIIGFVPLIVAGNTAGKEILYPAAVVIAFGLLTSTILNLLVTPVIFYRFHPKRKAQSSE